MDCEECLITDFGQFQMLRLSQLSNTLTCQAAKITRMAYPLKVLMKTRLGKLVCRAEPKKRGYVARIATYTAPRNAAEVGEMM